MTFEVRRASLDDSDAIARVETLGRLHPWSSQQIDEELQSPVAVVFVAALAGRAVGYVSLRLTVDEGEVAMIVVEPAARRLGVGRALMKHVMEWAAGQGAGRIVLEVDVTNAAALSMYRRLGFAEVGRRPSYYSATGGDALTMALSLDA